MNIFNLLGLVASPSLRSGESHQDLILAIPGPMEWWPILAVIVVLFGARKLPELARAMGSSVTQFRKGLESPEEEDPKTLDGKPEQSGE